MVSLLAVSVVLAACSLWTPEDTQKSDLPSQGTAPLEQDFPVPSSPADLSIELPSKPQVPQLPTRTQATVPISSVASPEPVDLLDQPGPSSVSAVWSVPPDRDLFELAYRFGKITEKAGTELLVPEGPALEVGHSSSFFVNDLADNTTYTIQATLQVVSENAYWYVDDTAKLSDKDLLKAADVYEVEIRSDMVAALGDISRPGVDGDPRLTVLHTPLQVADGYFGSSDQYPQSIHPHSNQREMIYMDSGRLTPGSSNYLSVLAHELQHAIHWNQDDGEDAWINEGMSELAKEQLGYDSYFVEFFLRRPDIQLNFWPDEIQSSAEHYGAASLFLAYLAQHYGGYKAVGELVRDPADGVKGIDNYLSAHGVTFEEVFKDWTVANYLDADAGPYGYSDRSVGIRSPRRIFAELDESDSLPQFAARYYDLQLPDGDYAVEFTGESTVAIVGTQCHSGDRCWWSGNGDSINSMLTREFDLTGLTQATLEFWTWYEIEGGWDYAYASVSTDGGERWSILKGSLTTTEDPMGNNFGTGFTSSSGQWVHESMDMTKFSDHRVHVRFDYVTDDAVNLGGFVIDDIGVPELSLLDDAETPGNWKADGFQLIDNSLPQKFALQIIEFSMDDTATVREIDLQDQPTGAAQITGLGSELQSAVLVIIPLTRGTFVPSRYHLSIVAVGDK